MADEWSEFLSSSLVEVRQTEGYGRGLYARSTLHPGAEIFQRKPFAHVLDISRLGAHCEHCLRSSDSLKKCLQCGFAQYCGPQCQKADWPLHKGECKGIASIKPNVPTPTIRLLVRLLQRRRERHQTLPEGAKWEVDLLCSHINSQPDEAKGQLTMLVQGVRKILVGGGKEKFFNAQLTYQVLCKVLCNTFSIYNESLAPLGAAVYVGPSLLNHSCAPNCLVVFSGTTFCLRVIENIRQGEQLLIGYVELLDTREKRQAHLKKVYNFNCNCQRCSLEEKEAYPFNKLYCSVDGVTPGERDAAMKEGWEKLAELDKLQKSDRATVVSVCEDFLSGRGRKLHPLNIVTVKILEHFLNSCLWLKEWAKALAVAERLTEPYKRYLPQYHVVCGLHYFTLGKLRRLSDSSDQLKLSIRDLTKSLDVFGVVYGGDHPTTQEAVEMLRDSQQELVHRRVSP